MKKQIMRIIGLTTIAILVYGLSSCNRLEVKPDKDYSGDYTVHEELSTGVTLDYTMHIDHIGTDLTITGFFDTEDFTLKGNTRDGLEITTIEVTDSADKTWQIVWSNTTIKNMEYCMYGNSAGGSFCSTMTLTKQ